MKSEEIKFYSQTGYGEWNEKVVGKPKQFCVLCDDTLDVLYKNGKAIWTKGHNAEPLVNGSCCNFCNDTKVIPARLGSVVNTRVNHMAIMENQISEMLDKLNNKKTRRQK